MLSARAALLAEFNKLHKMILIIVRDDKVRRQFMTVPGVGALVAITFKSAVDDPHGSRSQRQQELSSGLRPKNTNRVRQT